MLQLLNNRIRRTELRQRVSSGIPYPRGIHSYWKFNKPTGNNEPNILKPQEYSLIDTNTVNSNISQISGSRGLFDGDKLSVNNAFYLNQQILIEGWIYVVTNDATNRIIWAESGSNLVPPWAATIMYTNGGSLAVQFDSSGGWVISKAGLTNNKWHYVVFARLGAGTNDVRLYVDNILEDQTTAAGFTTNGVLTFGNMPDMTSAFQGYLSDFALWDLSLSGTNWDYIEYMINRRWNNGFGIGYING